MIEPKFAFSKSPTIESLHQIWSHSQGAGGEKSDLTWVDQGSMSKLHLEVRANQVSRDPLWSLQLDTGTEMLTLGTLISSDLDNVLEFVNKHFREEPDQSPYLAPAQRDVHNRLLESGKKRSQRGAFNGFARARYQLGSLEQTNFEPPQTCQSSQPQAQGLASKMALQFERSFSDNLSGAVDLPLFLFMLKHEFDRQAHSGTPFSILSLSVELDGEPIDAVVPGSIKLVAQRLRPVKRSCDVLTEFGASALLLLLHDTDQRGAAVVARRIQNAIKYPALPELKSLEGACLLLSIGIAAAPEEAQSLEALLEVVQIAREVTQL